MFVLITQGKSERTKLPQSILYHFLTCFVSQCFYCLCDSFPVKLAYFPEYETLQCVLEWLFNFNIRYDNFTIKSTGQVGGAL